MGDNDTPRTILLYACSGGANVAEAADRACRRLAASGKGTMFCLAGVGAGIETMLETARRADLNIIIDGCDVDCAKKIFENAGIANVRQIRVTDLDITKRKGQPATRDEIDVVVKRVGDLVAEGG